MKDCNTLGTHGRGGEYTSSDNKEHIPPPKEL